MRYAESKNIMEKSCCWIVFGSPFRDSYHESHSFDAILFESFTFNDITLVDWCLVPKFGAFRFMRHWVDYFSEISHRPVTKKL